jgi:hypothetical protein
MSRSSRIDHIVGKRGGTRLDRRIAGYRQARGRKPGNELPSPLSLPTCTASVVSSVSTGAPIMAQTIGSAPGGSRPRSAEG